MATRKPTTYHCPATRWSLDDLVAALQPRRLWTMSRSSLWRLLDEADLKPHRSVSWLNSHAPDFEAKAPDICALYLHALRCCAQGRRVMGTDEKTGMQMLQRQYPPQPMAPGQPEKREHESIRHGVRALMASFVVATGQVVWNRGQTAPGRTAPRIWPTSSSNSPLCSATTGWWIIAILTGASMAAVWLRSGATCPWWRRPWHRGCAATCLPERSDPSACLPLSPKHGSWLNQVEVWLSVLARRFLKRGALDSAHDFATRLSDYLDSIGFFIFSVPEVPITPG